MTQTTDLPVANEVASFFSDLLGMGVTANECAEFNESSVVVFADYSDDDQTTEHFVCCDVAGAAILSAALTGFPPNFVEEAKATGKLPENLFDNMKEILNIAVNLFPQSQQKRIVINDVVTDAEASRKYAVCEDASEARIEFTSDRYGTGVMIIGVS